MRVHRIPVKPSPHAGTSATRRGSWSAVCVLAVLASLAYLTAIPNAIAVPLSGVERAPGLIRARDLADNAGLTDSRSESHAWTLAVESAPAVDIHVPGIEPGAGREAFSGLRGRLSPPSPSRGPPAR